MHELDLMLQYQLEGRHEEARALSDKLEAIGSDKILDPRGENTEDIWLRHTFNRGWFLLNEGEYQKGCQSLESGRFINVYGNPPLRTKAPLYNPNQHSLEGKSIILSLEGGLGDEIIHARFATSFKKLGAAKVYIACSPELTSILSRIEGVDQVILRNEADKIDHDYWVPGFSAGWVAGHTYDDLPSGPYISPLQESVDVWKNVIKTDKVKVGIRWAGNPKFEHQQHRRFPVEFITNLSKYKELKVYSFQRDSNLVNLPSEINDLNDLLISWEDTAAAISCMDIIITSCTSVAHLAAAMGKETWIMVPCLPYHTWTWKAPHSTTSPYYDSVKLFRQKKYGYWNQPFQSLYSDLETRFELSHVNLPDCDKEPKKINLGSGMNKLKGFVNVDSNSAFKPDVVFDLNKPEWPWKDNEFTHLVAKDVLEHLGNTSEDFINVVKEMYRISENGAMWEIQFPHWNCDHAVDDIFHRRKLTINTFKQFDMQYVHDKMIQGHSDSTTAFEQEIDIQICDVKIIYTPPWNDKIQKGQISEEELIYALNTFNNVGMSVILLIQVHKPGRFTDKEFKQAIEKRLEKNA